MFFVTKMSSTFDINDEIDRLVDKLASDLKVRLKKSVARSEKLVVKQYTTEQKSTKGVASSLAKRPQNRHKSNRRNDSDSDSNSEN